MHFFILLFSSIFWASHAGAADTLPKTIVSVPSSSNQYSPYVFLVDKAARTLSVWKENGDSLEKITEVQTDMGKNAGAKTAEGDHRTPEGVYFLMERKEGPELDFKLFGERAFTMDYPNHFDRMDGKTGSGIWLHAVPDNVPLTRGSRGCVVVRNDTIKALTQYIKLGKTPVVIVDKMTPLERQAWVESSHQLTGVLQNWREAWQTKNMDKYMEFYSDRFRSQAMNKEAWKRHKTKLANLYKTIAVNFSKPLILMHGNRAVARFIQAYKSDLNADLGEKTLHLMADGPNGSWRIVAESWAEVDSAAASEVISSNAEPGPAPASQPLSSTR